MAVNRLAKVCAKLDPNEEKSLAEGLVRGGRPMARILKGDVM